MAAYSGCKPFCLKNIPFKYIFHRRKFCVRNNFNVSSLLIHTRHKINDVPSLVSKCRHAWKSSSTDIDGLYEPATSNEASKSELKKKLRNGPSLQHFLQQSSLSSQENRLSFSEEHHPYVSKSDVDGKGRKVFFETYGCQMNVNDTEIAWSILQNNGYQRTDDIRQSDVILVMTCAIREGAEQKIWRRLKHLTGLKSIRKYSDGKPPLKIGILGCMAERLKQKIVEKEKMVDLVAGPDSYQDLPRMLAVTDSGRVAVNVQLSFDETYADVMPVRVNQDSPCAFVSIMRGCDNMCSYCIVPFTRGRERSRPISSIIEEVKILSDQGIKEVTLLGQNVNSYCDRSEQTYTGGLSPDEATHLSKGFKTIYKPKKGGLRFADLLEKVSEINPEMRIRFTSPHPKDFPDEVLYLVRDKTNICKQLHLPAQCGSSRVLQAMRRGHTREAYLELIDHVRDVLPGVSLSSDFICGFCGETDEDFQETLSLIHIVKYNNAFLFPYSLREKTHAHRTMEDNVPQEVKLHRMRQMVEAYREEALFLNQQQIGSLQVIMIEGVSKRSHDDLAGRNDGNVKVIVPKVELPSNIGSNIKRNMEVGDYVVVKITSANSQVLKGIPLYITTLQDTVKEDFYNCSVKLKISR